MEQVEANHRSFKANENLAKEGFLKADLSHIGDYSSFDHGAQSYLIERQKEKVL